MPKESSGMKIETYNGWYQDALDYHNEQNAKAQESLDFYMGKQWDSSDLDVLRNEKRPSLVINKIFPIINFLSGYQRQNRLEAIAVNKLGSTREEAEMFSRVIKQVMDNSNGDYEVSMLFLWGCITSKSFLEVWIDYSDDPITGELVVERVPSLNILPDPTNTKYGLNKAQWVIKKKFISPEVLIQEFPKLKDEISASPIDVKDIGGFNNKTDDYANMPTIGQLPVGKQVMVKEVWYYKYEPYFYLYHQQSGELTEWGNGDMDKLKYLLAVDPALKPIEQKRKALHYCQYTGAVKLQEIEKPFRSMNTIPIIPFYPFYLDGNPIGVLDNLKDLQREVNKKRSQALHIVNTMANSGWLNQRTQGADTKELRKFGSVPGQVIEYQSNRPEQILPKNPPSAPLLMEEKAAMDMKDVSGVNTDLLGERGEGREPGIVLELRQQQGKVVLEPILDNLRMSQQLLGKLLVDIIGRGGVYTAVEVAQLIEDGAMKLPLIQQMLKNASNRRFGVKVSMQSASPTVRSMDFWKLTKAMELGVPIPWDVYIDASDLVNKDKILQALKMQQQQQGAPTGQPPPPQGNINQGG